MVAALAVGAMAVGGAVSSASASRASGKATDAQSRIAADNAELGHEQLDFDKQVYNEGKPYRDQASQLGIDVSKAQLASQDQQTKLAADYDAYSKSTFRPLEQKIVSQAENYDTPERRAAAVAGATSDVEQSYAGAQDGLNRSMARSGVTPGSGRSMALMQDAALSKANAVAGATTSAARNVETIGTARMSDAANLGRNLPSNQATSAGLALTAGNSATANANGAVNAQMAGVGNVNTGYAGSISANNSAGNLYGQVAKTYADEAASTNAALGQMGSAAAKAYFASDEDIKDNTDTPADGAKALEQINGLPVKDGWSYDPKKGGPDDGKAKHIGPMAQAVRDRMGESVAPGGKVISVGDMLGRQIAGMQELSKRLKQVERKVK